MLRVTRCAAIFVEPADNLVCDRATQRPLTFLRSCINRALTGRKSRNDFESVGNYLYKLSVREFEKLAMGMGLAGMAVCGINDFHGISARDKDGSMLTRGGGRFAVLWILIRLQDLLSRMGMLQPVLYSFALFKTTPDEFLKQSLKRKGYRFLNLPDNPYLRNSPTTEPLQKGETN